jgi:hypothetical protein
MTHSSMRMPITTTEVNTRAQGSQPADEFARLSALLSKADTQLSKAEIDLSKAEASEGRLEAVWVRSAKVAIIGLTGAVLTACWLIIVALREEYVYKKFLKSQHNA